MNFFDISPFISIFASNDCLAEADVNEDGIVNFSDIGPFILLLSSQCVCLVHWLKQIIDILVAHDCRSRYDLSGLLADNSVFC